MVSSEHFSGQSLEDWLSYLETIHCRSIDPGLERMQAVADMMDLSPLKKSVIVTVTGTNGKGSVTNLLAAFLRDSGASCNLYNSPHLIRFNERITVNGRMVSDDELLESFDYIEKLRRKAGVTLTFFEFTTLAAFYIFSLKPADYLILEVGMGGRYDSVNILDAVLAVITNVALDHLNFLGNTREEIGYQKVGILKKGGKLIYGEPDIPLSVSREAESLGAECLLAGRDFCCKVGSEDFEYSDSSGEICAVPLPVIPPGNAAIVLCALHALGVYPEPRTVRRIISGFSMPGRFELLMDSPPVYADVGHNPHPFRYLVERMKRLKAADSSLRFIAVVGMLRDKDYSASLNLLAGEVDALYLGSLPGARGETSDNLAGAVSVQNCAVSRYNSIEDAFDAALSGAAESGHTAVLAAGSFLTVAAVMRRITSKDCC